MNTKAQCPDCGKPLPEGRENGLCPVCLMGQAMNTHTVQTLPGSDPSAVPPSPEAMAERFPQFEGLECLGRGGMGVVYKARQKSLDRWVAIKVLAPERVHDHRFAGRFAREARTLARMNHPNIVTVFDHGETGGLFYIVMEYVDGVNLRDLFREGKMAPEQALAIVPPICEALEYAHDKGVIHRDIKPENSLLDREGRVKIADFGIASLVGGKGDRSGTPPYMAPEQEQGVVDLRADIYALGAVLYEMLTGERPAKDLVAPSKRVQIDVRIDEIVLRALDKEPSRRYQTAAEFRTMVETMAAPPLAAKGQEPEDRGQRSEVRSQKSRVGWYRVLGVAAVHAFALLLATGFFAFVTPRYVESFEELEPGLPAPTVLVINLSEFIKRGWVWIFPLLAGFNLLIGSVLGLLRMRALLWTWAVSGLLGLAALTGGSLFALTLPAWNRHTVLETQAMHPPGGTDRVIEVFDWNAVPAAGGWPDGIPVTVDGTPALKVENTSEAALEARLISLEWPAITATRYAITGEVKYEDVQGSGYLEMWSHFQPGEKYFSRTLGAPGSGPMAVISGSSGWRSFSLPFDRSGSTNAVSKLEVNLRLPGKGVVYLRGVTLVESLDRVTHESAP